MKLETKQIKIGQDLVSTIKIEVTHTFRDTEHQLGDQFHGRDKNKVRGFLEKRLDNDFYNRRDFENFRFKLMRHLFI